VEVYPISYLSHSFSCRGVSLSTGRALRLTSCHIRTRMLYESLLLNCEWRDLLVVVTRRHSAAVERYCLPSVRATPRIEHGDSTGRIVISGITTEIGWLIPISVKIGRKYETVSRRPGVTGCYWCFVKPLHLSKMCAWLWNMSDGKFRSLWSLDFYEI
jgi:hypothetical protein